MSGELERRDLRIANADRERAIAHLQDCTSEGRLDLDEFATRVDGVYAAKTFGELEPIMADLPAIGGPNAPASAPSTLEIRASASSIKRAGRWLVPRRIKVSGKAGSVRLDLSHAVIPQSEVDIDVSLVASSLKIILPRHATADDHDLDMFASSTKNRAQFESGEPGPSPLHFRLHGTLKASSIKIRRKWRFWRWEI